MQESIRGTWLSAADLRYTELDFCIDTDHISSIICRYLHSYTYHSLHELSCWHDASILGQKLIYVYGYSLIERAAYFNRPLIIGKIFLIGTSA